MDFPTLFFTDRTGFIDWLTQYVHDTTKCLNTYWYHDWTTCIFYFKSTT